MAKSPQKPKLTDVERYKRFIEMAEKVGASDDPRDFERAFKQVVKESPSATQAPRPKDPSRRR
jgi:hypothetical protein